MREWKLLQGCLRKGSGIMEELASELLKELNCDTAFSIKLPAGLPLIGGVQLDIAESVVITWVVMAVILILLQATSKYTMSADDSWWQRRS